jgi:hypothetical protein
MHSNPLKDIAAHEQIRRRSFRFIEEMEKNSFKHFIYYRCFEEDQLRGKSDSVDDTFRRLIGEGEAFLKMILDKYPDCRNEIHMLLVLQVDRHWLLQAKELVAAFKAERIDNKYRNIINAGYTLRRNDGDKKLLWVWHIQWIYLFLFQTHMPFSYRLAVLYKLLRRR